jgi:hypothetical protein
MPPRRRLPEFVLDGTSFDDPPAATPPSPEPSDLPAEATTSTPSTTSCAADSAHPDAGFILRWNHSDASTHRLGWPEIVRYIKKKLTTCHSSNIPSVQAELEAARRHEGQTLFQITLDIIRAHGPGGIEVEDNVHLILA